MTDFVVWPGVPYPLGATFDGRGVNFAVYSENATQMELCLFDPAAPSKQLARLPLADVTHHVWHGYVPGLQPGALYGFRASGPFAPSEGQRFNPNKLLADPYAKAFSIPTHLAVGLNGSYRREGNEHLDTRDSAPGVPKAVVVGDGFDWSGEQRRQVIWRKTVLYELHVKGFTQLHPEVPPELRGTYLGLSHPSVIKHLTELGVTSVQLLPVHERVSEGFLEQRGLSNYWGYNTLGFFAPDQRFASSKVPGAAVAEFKAMVKALHQAGIEVILDVVYNHTCEGNMFGPTLSLRGLDNPTYYRLDENDRGQYVDYTGCGNSVNVSHPQTLKLVLDSLRYWVQEMHVDGFRFDLCTTLARNAAGAFDITAPFFQALHQDPLLSRVKLIAEPWDLGPEGYKLGNFSLLFAEWNDRYRETMRRYWRGDERQAAEVGYRLSGSSDLFKLSGRRPTASVNYVTSHDGFTLNDLVSYAHKHNDANQEDSRDGASENHSFNCGVEGDTKDPAVISAREQQKRNFLATLMLSHGTPMLCAGDEFGRTQLGNNNAYCQDNAMSWVNWELDDKQRALLEFTQRCLRLRHEQPVLQRRNFFLGATLEDSRFRDLVWFRPDGHEMKHEDWELPYVRCVGMFLGGDAIATRDPEGNKLKGQSLLIYLNAHDQAVELTLPGREWEAGWQLALRTAVDGPVDTLTASHNYRLPGRSLVVFRQAPVV